MTPFPPSEGDTGATNMPDPGRSAPEGVRAVRDDLSGSVWRVGRSLGRTLYRQVGGDPSKADEFVGIMDTRELAELVRDALNARVSVDDATVERVAAAMAICNESAPGWEEIHDRIRELYRKRARAAVQALRDGPEPAPVHHECCPHCTARTGSCVRCGVRDAEGVDGEQLCGQCDLEVEAEALRDGGE